jgi:hypothetical protein
MQKYGDGDEFGIESGFLCGFAISHERKHGKPGRSAVPSNASRRQGQTNLVNCQRIAESGFLRHTFHGLYGRGSRSGAVSATMLIG